MEALSDVRGAYAIVAHDARDGFLYIARNNDRPLHIYSTNTRHYIMSEGGFLDAIISRYGKREKDSHTMYFKPEQLIKIDLSDPDKYYAVGDIQELRLKKEEAARVVAEDERKKYVRPAMNGNWHARNSVKREEKERLVPTKELKGCTFKVDSVEPFGTNYKYRGRTTDGLPVHFISDQRKAEYIGKVGAARIHSYVFKNQQQCLFVRHRDISWTTAQDVPEEEDQPGAGTFRTANNRRVKIRDWYQRIVNEGCDHCDATFNTFDFGKVTLTDDDKFLCQTCAKEFSVGGPKQETIQ
jgi:hypothetical protein